MINGIINVYKEKGYTSHDVVAKLRGIIKQKKIGHTGTLDPDAEGVLPVCTGKATKLCDMLTDKDKTYVAELLLGIETDTQDITGTVLHEKQVCCTNEQVKEVIQHFIGTIEQIPPMYSALKVNGKKLYELARQGIEVERKARTIQIYDIQILEMKLPVVKIEVKCSKGTYIRTLCHDIGSTLGCGGCMKSLVRTKVSRFMIEDSVTLAQIEEAVKQNTFDRLLLPIAVMFDTLPAVAVLKEFSPLVYNGNLFADNQCVVTSGANNQIGHNANAELEKHEQNQQSSNKKSSNQKSSLEGSVRVYDYLGQFIGIYEWKSDRNAYVPVKIFWENN